MGFPRVREIKMNAQTWREALSFINTNSFTLDMWLYLVSES